MNSCYVKGMEFIDSIPQVADMSSSDHSLRKPSESVEMEGGGFVFFADTDKDQKSNDEITNLYDGKYFRDVNELDTAPEVSTGCGCMVS